MLDPPNGSATDWFAYGSGTCAIARIVRVNGAPTLDTSPCAAPDGLNELRVAGVDASGNLVITGGGNTYVASPGGVTRVAHSSRSPDVIRVRERSVIVGWTGNDSLGDYACLASHPDRCWGVTGPITAPPSTLNAHVADDFFALMYITDTSSSATVTILRSIGTGNRPQPLP